ncbi:MAG TPA: hypothetical protein DIU39_02710 [Flavobacteriales bacterium]|nr:hypothetical protein [Flavobacteriales bacterium]|tara:strand:- start:209 stop:592 length:384 start_codon:yes stop_codon:yes gene_type:complete
MKYILTFILSGLLLTGVAQSNVKTSTQPELKSEKAEGKVVTYYPGTKQIMETGYYKNGQKHGQWIRYNKQGVKINEAYFDNGKPTGKWIVWDDNGVKRFEMQYENGKKTGTWYMWDENANLVSERTY